MAIGGIVHLVALRSSSRTGAVALAAGLLLALAAPTPSTALTLLREPAPADPTAPVVALLSALAWLLAGWLGLTVAVTVGARLPGLAGQVLAKVARRTAPRAVRHAVELALGMTVAVGALGAPSAAAASPALDDSAAAPVSVPSLDWGAPPAAPEPPAAEPSPDPAADPATRPPALPHHQPTVVVRPGDTLWELAAHELAARAAAPPTDAEVAQRWPVWWAANRDAVGDDPHHITPGLHLSAPPA